MSELTSDKLCTNYVCYCAGIRCCSLGTATEGGYLIAKEGGVGIIIAPSSTEVIRTWACINDATLTADANAGFGDWFVPTRTELMCYRSLCDFWDATNFCLYWSSSANNSTWMWAVGYNPYVGRYSQFCSRNVRAFRKVYY
jgi:hypothetical protein